MKYILCVLSLMTVSSVGLSKSMSAPGGIKYTISPLFGYETVFKATPTPHTTTRTMYGARLTAGTDLVSGELEYTKASDTENFLVAPEKIVTDDEKLKLGLRSTYRINDLLFTTGRLGGQATKSVRTETSAGVPVIFTDAIKYDPYAGLHIGLRFGPVALSIGATAIIRDTNDLSKNDIQHTFSITLGQ